MPESAYVSKVRIERLRGPLRLAYLPGEDEPIPFGVHGAVAKHYGLEAGAFQPNATTLDYVIAAAAG